MRWTVLVRGFAGHPLHPPLTDATVGAFTVGTIAAVVGWFDIAPDVLAPTALGAVVIGLVFAVPTVVTGFADFLEVPVEAPARLVAIIHMALMGAAASGFLVAALLLAPARGDGVVPTSATVVSVGALLLLTGGGWVGGTLAYVYGVRVLNEPDTPVGEALRPELQDRGADREGARNQPEP